MHTNYFVMSNADNLQYVISKNICTFIHAYIIYIKNVKCTKKYKIYIVQVDIVL